MISYAGLPALLVAMAVFAWCIRKVKLPKPLEAVETIGSYGVAKEDLKALGKRLEALKIPLSPELFSAIRIILTVLPVIMGLFLIFDRNMEGVFFLFATPMFRKLPELFLDFREKK